jgi:hypothetical protein
VKVVKFADDTKGGKIIVNTEDRDKLQQALDSLCDWADKWGMSFNLGKCKVMHVGTHNPAYEYFMRGVRLEEQRPPGHHGSKATRTRWRKCGGSGFRLNLWLHDV